MRGLCLLGDVADKAAAVVVFDQNVHPARFNDSPYSPAAASMMSEQILDGGGDGVAQCGRRRKAGLVHGLDRGLVKGLGGRARGARWQLQPRA